MNSLQTGLSALSNLWRSVGSEKFATDYLADSALVCDGPCLVLECGGSYVAEDENVSPTSHNDPGSQWSTEARAYDDDVDTNATCTLVSRIWSSFLELMLAADIFCPGVRFNAEMHIKGLLSIDLDHWNGSAWQHIYVGSCTEAVWVTKSLPAASSISKIRMRFFSLYGPPGYLSLHEFDFIHRKVLDVKFYDGFDTAGRRKHHLVLAETGNAFHRFKKPLYCASGLYVDFTEAVGSVFVRYLKLEDLRR